MLPLVECDFQLASDNDVRYLQFAESSVFVERAVVGQCVLVVQEDMSISAEKIVSVNTEAGRGVYSPVTSSGTLIADNVVTSVYSSFESHHAQHVLFSYVHALFERVVGFVGMCQGGDGDLPAGLTAMIEFSRLLLPMSEL